MHVYIEILNVCISNRIIYTQVRSFFNKDGQKWIPCVTMAERKKLPPHHIYELRFSFLYKSFLFSQSEFISMFCGREPWLVCYWDWEKNPSNRASGKMGTPGLLDGASGGKKSNPSH